MSKTSNSQLVIRFPLHFSSGFSVAKRKLNLNWKKKGRRFLSPQLENATFDGHLIGRCLGRHGTRCGATAGVPDLSWTPEALSPPTRTQESLAAPPRRRTSSTTITRNSISPPWLKQSLTPLLTSSEKAIFRRGIRLRDYLKPSLSGIFMADRSSLVSRQLGNVKPSFFFSNWPRNLQIITGLPGAHWALTMRVRLKKAEEYNETASFLLAQNPQAFFFRIWISPKTRRKEQKRVSNGVHENCV